MKSHDSNLTKKTTCNAAVEQHAQWLKITEKVSFNIASEASYVYILNGLKLIKNTKMINFDDF